MKKILSTVLITLLLATNAFAGLVSKPYTFTNNTVADASEVNADYDTLYTLVNGNLDRDNMEALFVGDADIDWGTGAGQVSATDMPIADAGSYYATDTVEAALQSISVGTRATTFRIDSSAGNYVSLAHEALTGIATWTFQNASDYVVGRDTTDTLTNKTLTSPAISSPTITGTPTAAGATWTNLGTVTAASFTAATITTATINGGTVNSTSVGATTPSTGAFTTVTATSNSIVPQLIPGQTINLGMTVAGSTITFVGGDGATALSATAPAYVAMPSVTGGKTVTLKIDGSQVVTLNLAAYPVDAGLGLTTTVAWANDMPMFLYLVNEDDTAANAGFFWSRSPNLTVTPAAGLINDSDAVGATAPQTQLHISGFWADDAGKAAKPCQLIGAMRMTWSTVTDRYVPTALTASVDGIGEHAINAITSLTYTMPVAQNGAAAGKYFATNGGTAPSVGAGVPYYTISSDGIVNYYFDLTGCSGGGVETAIMEAPYNATLRTDSSGYFAAVGISTMAVYEILAGTSQIRANYQSTIVTAPATGTQAVDTFRSSITYKAF